MLDICDIVTNIYCVTAVALKVITFYLWFYMLHKSSFYLQDSYLQSRAETMQNIESTIVELGGIFQQLAHMVKEQEEMVERSEF
jgi:hypothetical protein